MVFEPLSIIGIVGTTAGLIGFLAGTIEKLAQKKVEYTEHGRRLRWIGYQMNDCHEELQRWAKMWCNYRNAYPEDLYVYFWGRQGYNEITGRFELINEEHSIIHKFLVQSRPNWSRVSAEEQSSSQTSDFENWLPPFQDYGDNSNSTLFQKMADILYRNNILQERIKRLREMIEALHRRSRIKFFQLLRREDTGQSIRSLAEDLLEFDDRFKRFTRSTKDILELDLRDERLLQLVLQIPEAEGGECCQHCLKCLREGMDIETKLVAECPNNLNHVQVKTIWYKIENDQDDRSSDHGLEPPVSFHQRFLLDSTVGFDPQAGRLDRAKLAAGLTNYALMLARTRFFYHLSITRLSHIILEDGTKLPIFQPFQNPRNERDENLRRDYSVYKLRFLQLGTTLAEIAIGHLLEVSLDDDGTPIFSKEDTPISEVALLQEVKRRTLSVSYSKAIKYCIDLQASIVQRGYRIEDIEDCTDRILKPYVRDSLPSNLFILMQRFRIEEYYYAVLKHRRRDQTGYPEQKGGISADGIAHSQINGHLENVAIPISTTRGRNALSTAFENKSANHGIQRTLKRSKIRITNEQVEASQ